MDKGELSISIERTVVIDPSMDVKQSFQIQVRHMKGFL